MMDIKDVEIFKVGTWNGDKFSVSDLDEMVNNFAKVGYRPPVKLGHAEESGTPAYGWVNAIRRIGDKLVADFIDIPDKVADVIKKRMFDAVSSEIFFNLKRNGQVFKRALKAVALLGAEIPAVSNLKPLSETVDFSEMQMEATGSYQLEKGDFMSKEKENVDLSTLQEQVASITEKMASFDQKLNTVGIDKKTETKKETDKTQTPDNNALQVRHLQEQMRDMAEKIKEAEKREQQALLSNKVSDLRIPSLRDHFKALYELALESKTKIVQFTVDDKEQAVSPTAVLDDLVQRLNKHSEKLFTELGQTGGLHRDDQPKQEDPGAELDRLANSYASKHNVDYAAAFHAILQDPENVELKRAYAKRN